MAKTLYIDGNSLTISQVYNVAYNLHKVKLTSEAIERINNSRSLVLKVLNSDEIVYGINTGFGKFKDVKIDNNDINELQVNFMHSHACGVGQPFDRQIVRAMILLRINALAKGYSGIRLEVVQFMLELLNNDICPYIPQQGSVGSSGDLAPLAHLGLSIIGQGHVLDKNNHKVETSSVLAKFNLKPLTLEAKEALALTNGTQAMTAVACLVLSRATKLIKQADIISAMSLEAMLGSVNAYNSSIQNVRPHPGQIKSANNLRKILANSEFILSHKDCGMVQDAYSLRCVPQVHGAVRQAITHACEVVNIEINSSTDNPLIFKEGILSGGNFHGEPVALVMDYVSIALSELANIAERRLERLVNPTLSNGLPAFLTLNGGLNSGYMIAQYTAASLVSENKALSHPASVDSIPTSANQEDHVSMGTIASRKALMILENVYNVLAIELLCAGQGLDFRLGSLNINDAQKPDFCRNTFNLRPGEGVIIALNTLRKNISVLLKDRIIATDIEKACNILKSDELLTMVEEKLGDLE